MSAAPGGDLYPDVAEGVVLHKSATSVSGYKGVSEVRLPAPGFRARDGARVLGTFGTRVEAALAFARVQLEQKEERHHKRKDDRRRGKKRKKGGVELDKPEQASAHTHDAADAHYNPAEAKVRN